MQIRIAGGKDRGRMLKTLKGDLTRPTSGRVKEALFSILGPRIEGARFLDAFGGSGAVALEAISRGASQATIIEQNAQALRIIDENIKALGYQSCVTLLRGDALTVLGRVEGPFDLVFLDPPYQSGVYEKALSLIALRGLMDPQGWIIAEHPTNLAVEPPERWQCLKQYRYSDTTLSLFSRSE